MVLLFVFLFHFYLFIYIFKLASFGYILFWERYERHPTLRCFFGILSTPERKKKKVPGFKIEQQWFPVLIVLAFVHSDVGCIAPS